MDNVRHLNLPALFGAASDVQNRNVLRRINALKMREAEKGVEKRELRNELARRYFNPGEPASVEGRPAMSEGNAIGKYLRGGPEIDTYTPAETTVKEGAPPSFDYRGYGNALAKAWDMEGYLGVRKNLRESEDAALDRTKTELDIEKSRADLLNTLDKMDQRDRERTLKNVELIGNSQAGVYSEYEKLVGSGVPEPEARRRVQPLYSQSVNYLAQNGMGVGKLPPAFDPVVSRVAVDLAMSVKDQLGMAGGEGGGGGGGTGTDTPSYSDLEGRTFAKYLERGYPGLSPQEQAIVDRKLASDPLYAQAVEMVNDDIRTVNATPEEKLAKIQSLYESLQARSGQRKYRAPAERPQSTEYGKGGENAGGKKLDINTAQQILREAGGDRNRAREIARQRGYSF